MFCAKCQADKEVSEFYPSQKSECKECTRARVRANRRLKHEHYREYDRKRGNRQPVGYMKTHRLENLDAYRARTAVGNALRDGRLRKEPCFMCGGNEVHGHHVDYSKPLDVIWLCPTCHKRIHAYEDLATAIRTKEAN